MDSTVSTLKGRALHVICSTGIVRFIKDENYSNITAEIDLGALRSVTEADIMRYRNCGQKTAPVVMEYINNLRQLFL